MRRSLVPILFAKPGWVLPGATLDMDFANNRAWRKGNGLTLPASLLTTTRASTGYAATSSGLLASFANNIPRITDLGLLVEQAATNIETWSADFSNAAWSKTTFTVAHATIVAPDGTTTADALTSTGSDAALGNIATASASTTYTGSIWAKVPSGTLATKLQLADQGGTTLGSASNISLTTTWQRFQITQATGGVATGVQIRVGGFSTIGLGVVVHLWGAQLELGSFPTSYIPTTTVSVTRAADNITAALGSWFVPGQGTMLAKMLLPSLPPTVSSGSTFAAFNDGSNNNRLQLYMNNGAANPNTISTSGGVNQYVGNPGGGPSANIAFKIAMRWAASSYGSAVNGGAENTQASGSVPSGLTQLVFGASGSGYPNGYVQRFVYARSPLNTTSLTALP